MRNILSLMALVMSLTVGSSAAHSQTSFILGMAVGSAISSGSYGEASVNVLYQMPRAAERIKDPLELRLNYSGSRWDKYTIRERFESAVPMAHDYDIVQVIRVFAQGNAGSTQLGFVYIRKDLVIPLTDLPPESKPDKK